MLVTGASSGIGRAIALGCAREGADLAITYRANADGADEAARAIRALGRRAEALAADISREDDIAGLARWLEERFGRIDVWINNAGADILTGAGSRLSRLEKLDRVLAVDLRGTILASWAAVDLMRERGGARHQHVAGTTSPSAWRARTRILYSAAKGGIASFSKSLARQVAPGIRVNILAPGLHRNGLRRAGGRRSGTGRSWSAPRSGAGASRRIWSARRCSWPPTSRAS